ncbi:uncharacterized protein [Montipora capricornis]|uniref:uncharacterized protein n=1 Tax=Montipora capricornis TaxID=246305 RepID=UPI0035F1C3A2
MEVRVLFEGNLEKCTYDHGKKDWKRRYLVFKHILASNIRSLEFYASGTKNWKKAEPKGVLALYPGYEVLKVQEAKKQFVFEIKAVDHTYRLAAHSEDELNQWVLVLERESIVDSFLVEPETNEQLAKVGASDSCHLHIANNELRLLCAKDGRLLVAWPLTCLRRYMSSRGKFIVEAGRRAPTGEGKFTFLSPQHDQIYKVLDNIVKSRARKTGSSTPCSPPLNTKDKDVSHKCYDQVIPTSPAMASNQPMPPGSSNSLKNAYAAPYGHLPSRKAITTEVLSPVVSEQDNQYNTLNHSVECSKKTLQNQNLQGTDDEYCTLDEHLSPLTDQKNVYNVLNQHDRSQPITGMQYQNQQTQDVYNVLGEKLHSVTLSDMHFTEDGTYNTLHTMSSSQNQLLALASQGEEAYNRLHHANPAPPPHRHIQPPTQQDLSVPPAMRTPPRPLVKKPGEQQKQQTPHPSQVPDDDNDNTLATKGRPPSPIKKSSEQRAAFQESKSISLDGDSDAKTVKPRSHPPPPNRATSEQMIKFQKSQADTDETNMYNTLDSTAVRHAPVAARRLFHAPPEERGDVYNTLASATGIGASPSPVPSLLESDQMYNKLNSLGVVPKSHPRVTTEEAIDDMYNTLDKSRMELSTSDPCFPQRPVLSRGTNSKSHPNSPAKKDDPIFRRNSSSSSLKSVQCPLNIAQSQMQRSSSLDDLDSKATIDPAVSLSQNTRHKQIPIPVPRTLTPRELPTKPRKASVPDVFSLATSHGGKDGKRGGKSRLVLNLKASLEAGGLDFSKPRRRPRKPSREETGDQTRYAESDEHTMSKTSSTEEVFDPQIPPIRTGRSCSSPSVHVIQREDVYDELEHSALRPKSEQITKAKKGKKN